MHDGLNHINIVDGIGQMDLPLEYQAFLGLLENSGSSQRPPAFSFNSIHNSSSVI
jgi:hypothetical protein